MQKYRYALSFLFVAAFCFADDVDFPKPGEHPIFTKKWILERAASPKQAQCRKDLNDHRKAMKLRKKEYEELVAESKRHKPTPEDAIEKKESEYLYARSDYLLALSECGPCVVEPLEDGNDPVPNVKGVWGTAHAICYLLKPDMTEYSADERERGYAKMRDYLMKPKNYPRKNGGFRYVWEFLSYDKDSGKPSPNQDNATLVDGGHAFIAVSPGNVIEMAFSYYFKTELNRNREKEFILKFLATNPPAQFDRPEVFGVSPDGTVAGKLKQIELEQVKGMWFLNQDGVRSYFSAADFSPVKKFDNPKKLLQKSRKTRKVILLDTVVDPAERAGFES